MSQSPPNNYICRICSIPGHWIQQCPYKYHPTLSKVPSNYICHKCGVPGHWIQNCPNNYYCNNQQYLHQTARFDNNMSNNDCRFQRPHNSSLNGAPPSNCTIHNNINNSLGNYYHKIIHITLNTKLILL